MRFEGLAMLLAIVDGEKVYAEKGLFGICPGCHLPVIPKCGPLKIDHWAHKVGSDCDSWSEPLGPWHLSWQNMLRRDCIEVHRGAHRADAVGINGLVVELQHSPISEDDIRSRENFYGDMVWLFDATHRFTKVVSGSRAFFAFGRTKHIEHCAKPVFLDFGNLLVQVEQFTTLFPECSGVGIARSRQWFVDTYLNPSLKPDAKIKAVCTEHEGHANPWQGKCPYQAIKHPTRWMEAGKEVILPIRTPVLPLDFTWKLARTPITDDVIDKHPEMANGWTKESLHEMEGLLTGMPVIFHGLLRVMPALPAQMRVNMPLMTAWGLWGKAEEHMRAGRIPVLKKETKDRIMALSEQFGKSGDRRKAWKPRAAPSKFNIEF
jgi:competence protein CoiA